MGMSIDMSVSTSYC